MAETPQNNEHQTSLHPPITMKVDAPPEDEPEIDDNEKNSRVEDFKMCSPSTPFTLDTYIARGILKAPQLSLNNSKPSFVLNPSRLNPFAGAGNGQNDPNADKSVQKNGETPKFVPLIKSDKSHSSQDSPAAPSASSSSFVFGQNLQERVVAGEGASTSVDSNGTPASEMLFSSAVKTDAPKEKDTKTLSESAREYEESRASKRKYEEVEVITGEEGETNILKMTCKLFAFDKGSASWQERGRGVLRLNDLDVEGDMQSRLVFRTTGSLRVVLNTKIWAEMTVEQASEKSVRFTAMDPKGAIKVYLAMANMDDSRALFAQIHRRVEKEIQKHKKINAKEPDSGGD